MAPPGALWQSPSSRADTSPLTGKVPGCLEPETGSVPEAVLLLPVPEAVSLLQSTCSPFAVRELTCTDWSLRDPGPKMAPSPALVVQSPPRRASLLWRGRFLDVWSLKIALSQKLCHFCNLLAYPLQSVS